MGLNNDYGFDGGIEEPFDIWGGSFDDETDSFGGDSSGFGIGEPSSWYRPTINKLKAIEVINKTYYIPVSKKEYSRLKKRLDKNLNCDEFLEDYSYKSNGLWVNDKPYDYDYNIKVIVTLNDYELMSLTQGKTYDNYMKEIIRCELPNESIVEIIMSIIKVANKKPKVVITDSVVGVKALIADWNVIEYLEA